MLGTSRGGTVPDEDESGLWAPRLALLVTLAVLTGYTIITVLNVLEQEPGPGHLAVLAFCVVAVLSLQLAHSTRHPRDWPARTRALSLAAQAVATYLPLAWLGFPWGAMTGFLAGSFLLAAPARMRWALYVASAVGITPAAEAAAGIPGIVYGIGVTLLTGLIVYGVSSLSDLVAEIREARRALAGMAVVHERLRVSRDLHDLLGYSLSAIMLKSELGYRLLPAAPARARSEVAEVLAIARQALNDVRLVATGYRDMSLVSETESALSVLSAARIEATADLSCGTLPQEVDTVLAIVLREAVTNALRHSKAQHCVISATRDGGTVRLRILNDGVAADDPGEPTEGGNGLGNLATRLGGIGGHLTSRADEDGWFHAVAEAPAGPAPDDAGAEIPPEDRERAGGLPWAPRLAKGTVIAVLTGYTLITMINAADQARTGGAFLGFLGCFAVVVTLQTLHSLRRPRTWPVRVRVLTLVLQAAATYAPLLWLAGPWGTMAGFLAGSLLITSSGRLRWALYAASVAVIVPEAAATGVPFAWVVYVAVSSLVTGLVVHGLTALNLLVTELYAAKGALARLAVTRERLIVARELHEVLGSSLSAVTLKCELIHRLLPSAPEPAREELATVLDVSRQALADVRLVAGGYRGQLSKRANPGHLWPNPVVQTQR